MMSCMNIMEDAVVPVGLDETLGSELDSEPLGIPNAGIAPLKMSIAESASLAKKLNPGRRTSISRIGDGAPISPLTPSFFMSFNDVECMEMIGDVATPTTASVVASLPLGGIEFETSDVAQNIGASDLLEEIEQDPIQRGSAILPPSSPVTVAEVPLAPVPSKPKRHATRAGGRRSPMTKRASPAPSAGKTRRNAASSKSSRAREASPLLPIKPGGVLPVNHKPARGRGRQQQLKSMTKQQIEAEAEARLEKNRLAARDCRLRRKYHLETLEAQINEYEERFVQQERTIADLRSQIKALRGN